MDLQQRIGGKLPEIEIAGTMFYVETRLHELRADYTLNSRINLHELQPVENGYRFAFDTETKKLTEVDNAITEWPAHIVIVEIPNEIKLDPYSFAREAGLDPIEFVKEHPIETELKAKIIPYQETAFAALIEKNKKIKEQKLVQRRSLGLSQRNKNNRIQ